ncbi:MAG: hypothetical protein JXA13_17030 [Anaerolineales bacterium]|nr:hypothetical protein [Anaerolineales bacterium]
MIGSIYLQKLKRGLIRHYNNLRIFLTARRVARLAPPPEGGRPIAFFKASTGIDDLSWNSGFHLLAAWAFRLQGMPVRIFACRSGMSRCVLGTNRDHPDREPPCESCIYQSRILYEGMDPYWFTYRRDEALAAAVAGLGVVELGGFVWEQVPLGELCLPGLRWILRRYNLEDDEATRFLLREYILSAWNVAQEFDGFLDQVDPGVVIVFNGQFFPEAIARWVARRRGVRTIAHEVGLQPATAFFTEGEATAYPIEIPDAFELSEAQNSRLDEYLAKRFQGNFTMAGIKFWAEMQGLSDEFLKKAAGFKQIVPVFTNVIFDTSQPHANTIFKDMFAWLDSVLEAIKDHPETLFVIRAHPDETRLRKESRETVAQWVETNRVLDLANVVFIPPQEFVSSYELIQKSKFVMVYNSTIGLEASIMGAPVLCAGKARFTQYPTVFFPKSAAEVREKMEEFLEVENILIPPEFLRNARRFLYYQLFRTSLPFGNFLKPSVRKTQTQLKSFALDELSPEKSPAVRAIIRGARADGDFLLEE